MPQLPPPVAEPEAKDQSSEGLEHSWTGIINSRYNEFSGKPLNGSRASVNFANLRNAPGGTATLPGVLFFRIRYRMQPASAVIY